ncbi:TPA: GNAT family N-acetyltransferase [Streptococcus pyogenes]|uniref:GNAT family N-acetyltransferase n=1 Tax=Streptococcus pyogenes TaxID=1314 RepID=UPI0010A19D9F|nr:GNAT family N-acetyltransferase [Streptococcus pyogenes]VHE51573.1 acetyltransferase family protein [Streptococcus pyogenes]VHF11520.1 acetyltransferase family protein [Streptococcus pyogenes]HEP1492400.1 GNAT family N-acetyltransferase [Streptococcus pyogenes]HEP2112721.1 GNAT family N-acetyltransferase [Streptococcus pyogenes]HEP2145530.1 GNAT family N-acetyltransferase [Streptococcus pyogenes]
MLRPLSKTDCPSLKEINDKALGYCVSLDLVESQFERLIEDCHHYFLAYADKDTDQLLGYVHAERYETLYASDGLNLLGLAVLPAYQRRGIGSALLRALESQAKQESIAFIRLNSASHRKEAHAFYRNLDYADDKTQLRFIKNLQGDDNDF